jgi:hypothetical protein
VLVWDLTRLLVGGERRPTPLSTQDLDNLWSDLASRDAVRAYRALEGLSTTADQAVSLVRRRLRPAVEDRERIDRLIADLGSERYPVRQQAMTELTGLLEVAEARLRQVLKGQPALELRRRVEGLLQKLDSRALSPSQLRELRALTLLERLGTPAAREALEALSRGAPHVRLTREA